MKRDWGLIRRILQKVEDKSSYGELVSPDSVDGYDVENVSYHMHLLDQAGLITAQCRESTRSRNDGIYCVALNLTWEGHELLDSIKNDTVWNRLRKLLREKSIELSYSAVKAAAVQVIKENLLR
jgi:DNA-binding transcriptional ArsR family regulator